MNVLPVPLVAMEGYYSKFTIFTGATTSQKMQIWWGSVVTRSTHMKENVTSGCIYPSILGDLLKFYICHFTAIHNK